jgi:DNA-binding beta-propeller fold protein YncE
VVALRLSGRIQGTFPVGTNPVGIAYDGANIWTANQEADTVTRLRARSGLITRTIPVEDQPIGILYDGMSIWVANASSNTVDKISPSH